MNKFRGQPKLRYLSSSEDDDDDYSSTRNESLRTNHEESDDYSLNKFKINDHSKTNESTDKSNETSDNDVSPTNHWMKKKNRKRIISSDDSDGSDNENSSRHSTNASSEFGSQHSRSNNGTGDIGDILVDNSADEHSASTSTQDSKNEVSVFIPETDDEEEEKMFQEMHLSPKTRRSITGRRSIAPGRLSIAPNANHTIIETSDEDDDFFKISDSKAPDDNVELNSNHFDSFGLERSNAESLGNGAVKRSRSILLEKNESAIQTPQSKRFSRSRSQNDTNLTTSSIGSNTKSYYMDLTKLSDDDNQTSGIHIQSTSTTDESESKYSRSSIIELESSSDGSDDDYVPDIQDVSDFGKNIKTSTPGTSKKLIQPKIGNAMKITRFVSREYYEKKERELNAARAELKEMINLYDEIKGKLSDNGDKLMKSIETLKFKIGKMENELAQLKVEEDNVEEVQAGIAAAGDWRAGLNQIEPKYTGKIGLKTHNTQKALTINRLEKLHKALELCPGEHELAKPPPHLKVSLMPHQLHAIKWMRWREKQKPKGGILADDMGLGKTLTVIALVLDAIYVPEDDDDKENENADDLSDSESDDFDDDVDRVRKNKPQKNGGTLVVCPASLVNQWNQEIQTRVKHNKLVVLMHHGSNRRTNVNMICKNDVVLTTYGVISSEHKSSGPLYRIKWDRIVLDEAHMIRNHTTAMAKATCELRSNIRWGLTGTPIQNKAMDVYSMMKYLRVSPFDDLQTFLKFSDPRSAEGMSRLHNILKPLLLRRTKTELQTKGELAALPEKTINIEEIDLSSDESSVYMHVLAFSQDMFIKYVAQHEARKTGFMVDAPFVVADDVRRRLENIKRMPFSSDVKTSTILVLLLRLRQICDHPGLIKSMLNDDDLGEEEVDENNSVDMNMMKAMIGLDIHDSDQHSNHNNSNNSDDAVKLHNILSKHNAVYDLNNPSSKCKRVTEMVKRILKQSNDKMVIVSQWTSVLGIIADHLNRERIEFVELTGKTPIKSRNDIVCSFNQPHTSERIMLLSLVAGGVGLNLTGANHLFLLDPHWNPQLESQAFDRVYRVGQVKNVQIYKLLCNNTIEKRIQEIQASKLELSDNVLTGSKKNSGSKLSFRDMCALFEINQ